MRIAMLLKLGFFLSLGLVHFPQPALSQLQECKGTWTNKPCTAEPTNQIVPTEVKKTDSVKSVVRDSNYSVKSSMFHELTMKNISAQRDFGIRYDISDIQQFCLEENSSVEDCRTRIDAADEKLETRMHNARMAKAEENQNNSSSTKDNSPSNTNPTTVIIEDTTYIVAPRRRYHGYNNGHPSQLPYKDPRRSYHQGGSAIGVNVSGNIGGSNVTVSGHTGGQSTVTSGGGSVSTIGGNGSGTVTTTTSGNSSSQGSLRGSSSSFSPGRR